jgi:asparagine synthase (glutamine-hydrolysing)
MCGICGFAGSDEVALYGMISKLIHRGPDDQAMYVDDYISLGMTRLAILDLVTGNQPIWNETRTKFVISNGEIYNYKELRSNLEKQGHHFLTNTDTEVIIHLYEEYKDNTPKFLNGMFAFCVYDLQEQRLFIARDRFGEKPLYYYSQNGEFAFSSELKSLLQYPKIKRVMNVSKLPELLSFGFCPDQYTLFKNVYSIPPGHSLSYQHSITTIQSYFQIENNDLTESLSENEIMTRGKNLLWKSVERQMVSDVPIGAFLSGGIDSSTIAAIMQQLSPTKINTFNVRFEESAYDESPIAKAVARHLGTQHHEINVPNQTFDESVFREIIDHVGFPFSDSSAIPSYLVTKEIRKHVKVALSGDGGDELFGGYSDFVWGLKIQKLKSIPKVIRNPIHRVLLSIPESEYVGYIRKLEKAFNLANCDSMTFFKEFYSLFKEKEMGTLILKPYPTSSFLSIPDSVSNKSFLRNLMWFRLKYLLPEDMLIKMDRMSMIHSLEVRSPFLDKDLFRFSQTLEDKFLIRGNTTKWILRQIMKKELPAIVFNHPKTGFNLPLHKFFNKEFEKLTDHLVSRNHPLHEILDYNVVRMYLNKGFKQMQNTSKESVYRSSHKLWLLVQLYAWFDQFELTIE